MTSKGQEIVTDRHKVTERKEQGVLDLSSVQVSRDETHKSVLPQSAAAQTLAPSQFEKVSFSSSSLLRHEIQQSVETTSSLPAPTKFRLKIGASTQATSLKGGPIRGKKEKGATLFSPSKELTSPTVIDRFFRWLESVIKRAIDSIVAGFNGPAPLPLAIRTVGKTAKEEEEEEKKLSAEEKIARARKKAEEQAQKIHTE